jgi:hypothetical protein
MSLWIVTEMEVSANEQVAVQAQMQAARQTLDQMDEWKSLASVAAEVEREAGGVARRKDVLAVEAGARLPVQIALLECNVL